MSSCQGCRRRFPKKGYRTYVVDNPVTNPRYRYRCKGRRPKTFSPLTELLPEHTAPEFLWLETRWASLSSSNTVAGFLKDILPIGLSLDVETVRNHLHEAARRMEGEPADEQVFVIETYPRHL